MKWFTIAFPGETQHGSAFLRLALPVVLCFAFLFTAHAESPLPGTNRFLFVIDTSTAAKKMEEPISEAVFDLLYSGVRGNMTNGDTFGIWFAGGRNDTSMGVETWKQKYAVEVAARISLKIKEHAFKGNPALDAAITDAMHVAETVQDVTVIITSTGENPLRGTPFDDAINARVQQLLPEMQQAKAAFNTVLVARDGKFVAWAVNSPEFLINLPLLPPREPKKEIKEEKIAKAAASDAAKPSVITPARPKIAANPIIITRETVDREKQAMRAMATTETETPRLVATNVPAKPAPITTNFPAVVIATNTSAPTAAVVSVVSTAPVLSNTTVSAKTNAAVAATLQASTDSELSAKPEEASVVHAASADFQKTSPATVTASSWTQKLGWALAGCAVMTVLLLVCFALVRRARAYEPSLITQAAALERTRQ